MRLPLRMGWCEPLPAIRLRRLESLATLQLLRHPLLFGRACVM